MNVLFIILLTVLILANLALFGITVFFSKDKKDRPSKIGFGFMELLTLANAVVIGGFTVWVF